MSGVVRLLGAAVVAAIARLYRIYHRSLRLHGVLPDGSVIRSCDEYPRAAEIFALCERDALALAGFVASQGVITLVAPGRDGDWATVALRSLGYKVVRGASGRGGTRAAIDLVRRLQREPAAAAIVVDGPLGPAGKAKPGIMLCAQRAARPVRPLAAAARFSLVFGGSWSRLYLPMPFSRLAVVVGEHIEITESNEREPARRLLDEGLAAARRRAVAVVCPGRSE